MREDEDEDDDEQRKRQILNTRGEQGREETPRKHRWR